MGGPLNSDKGENATRNDVLTDKAIEFNLPPRDWGAHSRVGSNEFLNINHRNDLYSIAANEAELTFLLDYGPAR